MLQDVAGEPDWPLEGFGSLWLLAPDQEEPSLLRVDPATNEIVATAVLPGRSCQGYTVSDDAVWSCTPDGAIRIDPETNAIVDEVEFETGMAKSRVAYGDGSIWVSEDLGGSWATNDAVWVRAPEQFLTRIDPTTNEVVEVIDGPVGAGDVTVAFGSVWATSGHAHGLSIRALITPTRSSRVASS